MDVEETSSAPITSTDGAVDPTSELSTAIDVDADGDGDGEEVVEVQPATEGGSDAAAAGADGAEGGEEDEEEEEEYEIESILAHEDGRFVEGEMAYLVSWKDYGEEHNSWVRAVDAEGAQEMINDYWARTPKKDIKKAGPTPKSRNKKGKQSKGQSSLLRAATTSSPAASASKKRARDGSAIGPSRTRSSQTLGGSTAGASSSRRMSSRRGADAVPSRSPSPFEADDGVDERLEEIANDDTLSPADKIKLQREHLQQQKIEHMKRKYGRIADWDPIVRSITGIENIGGKLWAYFNFMSGDQLSFPLVVAEDRCPRQLNKFFIAHLRFKTTEGLVEYVAPTPEPAAAAAAPAAANGTSVGDANGSAAVAGASTEAEPSSSIGVANGSEAEPSSALAAETTSGDGDVEMNDEQPTSAPASTSDLTTETEAPPPPPPASSSLAFDLSSEPAAPPPPSTAPVTVVEKQTVTMLSSEPLTDERTLATSEPASESLLATSEAETAAEQQL